MRPILFDMDGVLVDSEPVIRAAAAEGLNRFGFPAREEDFIPFTGMGENRFIGGVAEKYGGTYAPEIKAEVYRIYGEIVDARLGIYPGARPTLMALKAAGRRMALASSSDYVKIGHNLRVANIPTTTFLALVGGEDVERKKPFPDIYLLAAERLGVRAEDCIVIEDALSGVQAGRAAGAHVIAVATSFSPEALREAGAHQIIKDIGALIEALDAAP